VAGKLPAFGEKPPGNRKQDVCGTLSGQIYWMIVSINVLSRWDKIGVMGK